MKLKKFLMISTIATSLLSSEYDIEPISIVSTKVSDTQMNTSSSVDIVTSKDIEQNNINSIEDLSSIISNINISGIGNRTDKTFTFRGISNYIAYDSSVAMYIDNVPFTYGYGAFNMNDIENIEILKGPQGTLFGKNSESGVINIFTKPTTKKYENEISINLAQNNTKNFYIKTSGPMANKNITYKFSLTKDTSNGYSKNAIDNSTFDTKDLRSFNAKINYKKDDNTQITLSYTKTKTDDGGSAFKVNTKENPFEIQNEPYAEYVKADIDLASVLITNKNDNYKFTSSTAYSKQDISKKDYLNILAGVTASSETKIQEITQEFRLNHDSEKFNFLLGAFYSDKLNADYNENQTFSSPFLQSKNNTNNVEGIDENKALFAQTRYWIEENYSLSVGGRYQEIKKDFSREVEQALGTLQKSDSKTWSYFTPTVSFLYYGENDYNTYATYSQGYRPGGYNYSKIEGSNILVPYLEEKTQSLELGYKSNSKPFDFSFSLFYNKIENLRINTLNQFLAPIIINAQESYTYGAELNTKYTKNNYELSSSLAITKAKIKELNSNTLLNDKNLIEVPNITANILAKYKINKNYYVQSNINHMGKRYYNIENTSALDSYTIMNIGTGYNTNKTNILLYVNNLFDKEYNDFMIATPTDSYYHFGKPRVIGIKLTQKF